MCLWVCFQPLIWCVSLWKMLPQKYMCLQILSKSYYPIFWVEGDTRTQAFFRSLCHIYWRDHIVTHKVLTANGLVDILCHISDYYWKKSFQIRILELAVRFRAELINMLCRLHKVNVIFSLQKFLATWKVGSSCF